MKKSLCYKFKETSLAIDASMAYDQSSELEQTVDYESFMKECLACESVCKSKFSPLEIPGLPEGSIDSVEQTALTRAKATMLMNDMFGGWQTSKKHRKTLRDRQVKKKQI